MANLLGALTTMSSDSTASNSIALATTLSLAVSQATVDQLTPLINGKAPRNNPSFTGTVTGVTAEHVTSTDANNNLSTVQDELDKLSSIPAVLNSLSDEVNFVKANKANSVKPTIIGGIDLFAGTSQGTVAGGITPVTYNSTTLKVQNGTNSDVLTLGSDGNCTFEKNLNIKGNVTLGDTIADSHTLNGSVTANKGLNLVGTTTAPNEAIECQVSNNAADGGAQVKLGVGAYDIVSKKRSKETAISMNSAGTVDVQTSGGSVTLSPFKQQTMIVSPLATIITSDVSATRCLQTQNFNWVRNISSTITYDQPNWGGKWKKIGFNAAQTSPNLDRTYPNAGGLPQNYNSAWEAFEIVRSGVYAMRVQLWFKTDHQNKQPLSDSWVFSGSMYLRFVVRDPNGYQYELSANQKLHSEYVSIDEVTLQDISYLGAGWKLWVELSVNFPALKDGQVVMPPKGEKSYPSSFKLALIS